MGEAANLPTLGARVKWLRKELGLTQEQFARLISVSDALVAFIETDRRVAKDRIIKLIADSFSVSREWLKTGEGEIFVQDRESKNAKLLALFAGLKPKYQDYIIDAIDRFLRLEGEESPLQ
ncbi:MAG: helix-turn-helix transcriptional regulator [Spirochaetaceae bacterium]|jgi:transcriptional regulator with XRE-family HTH domain|nr:helix-turn-helix transcriptional regulator [Spirochaetaceae bacterium]